MLEATPISCMTAQSRSLLVTYDFSNREKLLSEPLLNKAVEIIAKQLNLENASSELLMDWALVDNATIQGLNAQYRHKNQATDVLSFPIYNNVAEALATKQPQILLGQVVVSAEWAEANCRLDSRTKDFADPLQAYIVDRFFHGTLHCLGQHHDTDDDYATVIAAQNAALAALFPTSIATPTAL